MASCKVALKLFWGGKEAGRGRFFAEFGCFFFGAAIEAGETIDEVFYLLVGGGVAEAGSLVARIILFSL